MIIFPESRVAIEEYRFDAAKGNLRAVLQVFLGQVLIHRASQVQQPDFVIKTHTAVVRFRGAEFGCRLYPNFSTIMNFAGHSSVINISPDAKEEVNLNDRQRTTVAWARPPTLPFEITAKDRQQFINQLPLASMGLEGGTHVGAPVAADVVAPGASTVSRDLGLNIGKSVMPTNILANPSLVNSQVRQPMDPIIRVLPSAIYRPTPGPPRN